MAVRLRTRLFLVVAAVLGASVVASALLSRRATLVEVHEVVNLKVPADPTPILDRSAVVVSSTPGSDLGRQLAGIEQQLRRPVLVFEPNGTIVAASNPALAAARVRQLTPDGNFVGDLAIGPSQSTLTTRGAPTRRVTAPDGRPLWILLLPVLEDGGPLTAPPRPSRWVWTTIATVFMAVPLVFAVSRRILGPITAMTAAARRMQEGDLDVRVPAYGGDELGELARAFNAMASRLAETERQRRQMVSDVAHELRSPVTNLRCTLEAIQDGLTPPDRSAIQALHDETLFLQRLIADLQDLALADAGQFTMQVEDVDLADVLRRATAATQAADGGTPIVVDLPARLPPLRGDAARLEQVFRNLVANARTHTPQDGRIELRACADGAGVRVSVTDTGGGIPASHLPHVFERFYRADPSRTRATGGAGLGLAIVRQLVTAHGGTVTASSHGEGAGSQFVVTLPTRG